MVYNTNETILINPKSSDKIRTDELGFFENFNTQLRIVMVDILDETVLKNNMFGLLTDAFVT